jgi:hypothetical protein
VDLAGRYSNRHDLQKLERVRASIQLEGTPAVPRRRKRPSRAKKKTHTPAAPRTPPLPHHADPGISRRRLHRPTRHPLQGRQERRLVPAHPTRDRTAQPVDDRHRRHPRRTALPRRTLPHRLRPNHRLPRQQHQPRPQQTRHTHAPSRATQQPRPMDGARYRHSSACRHTDDRTDFVKTAIQQQSDCLLPEDRHPELHRHRRSASAITPATARSGHLEGIRCRPRVPPGRRKFGLR